MFSRGSLCEQISLTTPEAPQVRSIEGPKIELAREHHLMAREYDRAIPQALKTIEISPNFVQAHRVLGLAYLYTRRFKEACAEFEKGVDLSHNDPVARAYLARCYARSQRGADARSILETLISDSSEDNVSPVSV